MTSVSVIASRARLGRYASGPVSTSRRSLSSAPVSDADAAWFRAFASYRFGVITAFNVMLHRRGKRHDPHWEDIALSAPTMFSHGIELLGGDGERLLRGFLGEVEVAEEADQGGQDAAPFLAEDLGERRYQYTSEGRISTAPP